jgi:hypothetical protein
MFVVVVGSREWSGEKAAPGDLTGRMLGRHLYSPRCKTIPSYFPRAKNTRILTLIHIT